jgi:hypothetical protein
MITIIDPAQYPIAVDKGQQSQFVTHVFVALEYHARAAIRAMGDQIESRFATFAGVPYQDPLSRQQWEQIWESEPYLPDQINRVDVQMRCPPKCVGPTYPNGHFGKTAHSEDLSLKK